MAVPALATSVVSLQPGCSLVSARPENTRQTEAARLSGSPKAQGLKNEKTRKHFHRRRRRRGEAIRATERSKRGARNRERKKCKSLTAPPAGSEGRRPCLLGNSAGRPLQNALTGTLTGTRQEETRRQGKHVLCFTVSWAPTPAAFSATSLKNEMLVFVPGSLNLNYITEEETSRRK